MKWIYREKGVPFASPTELREAMIDEIAAGHELLPTGPCDNFDYKQGCRGHRS